MNTVHSPLSKTSFFVVATEWRIKFYNKYDIFVYEIKDRYIHFHTRTIVEVMTTSLVFLE